MRDKLRARFNQNVYSINTWRDKQGPLLAAVQMETAILNVLLFLIIAVAGFGILAIFFMLGALACWIWPPTQGVGLEWEAACWRFDNCTPIRF